MLNLVLAAVAFVGTHFVLSHPLRRPLVRRIGEGGFLGLYSLVAVVTLGWLVVAYRAAPWSDPWWGVGDGLWAIVSFVMLAASVLLVGSLIGNPALPNPVARDDTLPGAARGVYAVTRHPMLWSFALWAIAHVLVLPILANLILCLAILLLSLVGAALQDRKKEQLRPAFWRAWEAKTSYWPFAAIAAGRARFGGFRPHDLAGGLVVWLTATWVHLPIAGVAAGVWRWLIA